MLSNKHRIIDGRKVIEPQDYSEYKLEWTPEPFFADISDEGIVEHKSPEIPNSRVFLAATISSTQFNRHAAYIVSKDYDSAAWQTLRYSGSADPIYLLAENDSDDIFCLSSPLKCVILFGKMLKDNIVYTRCSQAFKNFLN